MLETGRNHVPSWHMAGYVFKLQSKRVVRPTTHLGRTGVNCSRHSNYVYLVCQKSQELPVASCKYLSSSFNALTTWGKTSADRNIIAATSFSKSNRVMHQNSLSVAFIASTMWGEGHCCMAWSDFYQFLHTLHGIDPNALVLIKNCLSNLYQGFC